MRRALLALAAAMLAVPPAAAQDEVLSKDLRAKSDRDAERQARRDLDALLQEFSGYNVGSRKLFQGDVWFWTDPRSSGTKGLWERDLLQVIYHPTDPRSRNSDTFTVRARGLAAERYYGFTQLPDTATLDAIGNIRGAALDGADRLCRSTLSKEWSGWFRADSEFAAIQGALALMAAKEAVDTLDLSIGCEEWRDPDDCRRAFDFAAQPSSISRVTQEYDDEDQVKLFRIDAATSWIRIELKKPARIPTAANIASVKYDPYIVIT